MSSALERCRQDLTAGVVMFGDRVTVIQRADLALLLAVADAAIGWEESAQLSTDRDAAAKLHMTIEALTQDDVK